MRRITVGHQDACLYPLWMSRLTMRMATLCGARAIWVPDHFMGFAPRWLWREDVVPAARQLHSMDALFDPIPILTLAAVRHPRAWIGTSVTDPIRRHPMCLAQTFATLDHVARGRVILGLGNGLRENTEPYGFPCERRVARLEEALEIITALWASKGRPLCFDGRFWKLRDAVFDLPLYRDKPPRVFLGAHFPRMLRLCGQYADGWLPGQKTSPAEYAARLRVIQDSARRANRSLHGFVPAQTLLVAYGRSKEAVLEKALRNKYVAYLALGLPGTVWKECGLEHPLGEECEGFVEMVPARVNQGPVEAALRRLRPELLDRLLYMGTPRDILAEAAPLAGAGCRHFIIANMGAAFMGEGVRDFLCAAQLTRLIKRLNDSAT